MIQSNFLDVTFVDEEFNSLNIIVVLILPAPFLVCVLQKAVRIFLADSLGVGTLLMCYLKYY